MYTEDMDSLAWSLPHESYQAMIGAVLLAVMGDARGFSCKKKRLRTCCWPGAELTLETAYDIWGFCEQNNVHFYIYFVEFDSGSG